MFCSILVLFALGCVLSGCTMCHHPSPSLSKNGLSEDVHAAQTKEMRESIDSVNSTKKQKGMRKGFQYGGLSSEAREIEDHLYGN